jgi:hypothetical protein
MAVLVSDSFNRANNTTSLGSTDSYNGGTSKAWQIFGTAVYGINNNQAYISQSATTGHGSAYIEVNSADVAVTSTFSVIGAGEFPKIAFRIVDAENMLMLMADSGTGNYLLYKYVSGSSTDIATGTSFANGDVIRVEVNGSNIKVFKNGTSIINVTETSYQTATKHGLMLYKYPNSRMDNFIIEDFSAGTGNIFTKSLSDSIAFSETLSKRYSGFKTINDAISSAETFAKQFTGYKTLSDSVPSSDSVSRQFTARKTVTDSITSSDSISKRFTATIIDSIATGDAENEQSSKLLNDIISSFDSVSSTKGKAVNLSDSIAITETIRKALAKVQSDTISSTDVESESINRRLNDAITQTDTITTFKGKTVTLSDSITLTDALNKAISSLKIDSVGLSESFGKTSAVSVRIYDVIISSDHVDTFLPNVPTYNEVISLTLEIAQGKTVNLTIVERGNYELDVVERKTIDIKI